MEIWRLGIAFAALSCAAAAYAVAIYLIPRPIETRTVWLVAVSLGTGLTAAATLTMYHALDSLVPARTLLKDYAPCTLSP